MVRQESLRSISKVLYSSKVLKMSEYYYKWGRGGGGVLPGATYAALDRMLVSLNKEVQKEVVQEVVQDV